MKLDTEAAGAAAGQVREAHEETWLLGQAPMRKYLDFVSDLGLAAQLGPRTALVEEWGRAAHYYEELAVREAGIADHMAQREIDPELAPLAGQVSAHPRFAATFDTLPVRIVMVEVAKLVVCQNHVTRTFVEALKARLGPKPDPAALLRFCLPLDDCRTPVRMRESGARRITFTSGSTDLRYHESMLLKPQQLRDYSSFGEVAGVVGIAVGFSSNWMNAVCDDDSGRLLLHNGYHRACALLELGIRHAPCVVQTVGSRDELDLVAKSVVAQDPGYFFNAPRPPLLKDFADPRIRKVVPVKKVSRVIEVSWEVRDYFVED